MNKLRLVLASLAVASSVLFAQAPEPANARSGFGIARAVNLDGVRFFADGAPPAHIELAQTYDHTWNPGSWSGPGNTGVTVTNPQGNYQYQYYAIQTGGTNGFIIVYYNLVCVGPGRCRSTDAAPSCWITGYGNGTCAEGANASIPRNL